MDDRGGDSSQKRLSLPEVPLKWTDFMWSLEKLRHRPYSRKTRERDWFRINPLEMVLLGCQSLISNSKARRDNVTMVITMGPLTEDMLRRPRYWSRTISVLCRTVTSEDVPATVLQRCCSTLSSLWRRLVDVPELHPIVRGWCVGELNMIEVVEKTLCKSRRSLGAPHSSELEQLREEMEQLLALAAESCERLLSKDVPSPTEVSSNQDVGLRDLLVTLLEECGIEAKLQLQVQVYLMYKSAPASSEFKINLHSVLQLVSVIRNNFGDLSMAAVYQLLAILQLFAVRRTELESLGKEPAVTLVRSVSWKSSVKSDLDQTGEEEVEENEEGQQREGEDNVSSENEEEESPPPSPTPQLLIDALTASLKKWSEICEADSNVHHPPIAHKLLSLIHTILSFRPLNESLPKAFGFLEHTFSILVAYCTEGYLSESPGEFLEQLLEFIISLLEQGSSLDEVLLNNLPNLFGPAFGVRNHCVSCKLLEFGYLSVCSQHKQLLLTKGLKFLMEVFHLFPPLDKVVAEAEAKVLRIEAFSACTSILEQVFCQVVAEEVKEIPHDGAAKDSDELEDKEMDNLELESDLVVPMVTEETLEADKQSRLQVLLKLLQLACAMIRSGEDITFVFASTLPKLFRAPSPNVIVKFNKQKLQKFFGEEPPPPPSQITWTIDKKELAIQLLDLATLFVENNAASPFQLCGIVVPKLVKNLNLMNLSDEEKMSLTLEVIKVTRETLEEGHDVSDLISHGIDLIAILLPQTASCEDLRVFISQIATHLVTFNLSSMLFLIKNACQFMKNIFPNETEEIQELFKALLFRGKRDEIRGIFRVCKEPKIKGEHFLNIHRYLYGYASGKLSHRQLIGLCEVLIQAMDTEKPLKVVREIVTNVEEEDESVVEARDKLEKSVMTKLVSPCLQKVETALRENRFKRDVWEHIQVQLSQIALFRTLFQSEFASFSHLCKEQLLHTFKGKFPPDVLGDEDTMALLSLSATRIEHMQVPRYDSLKTLLAGILRHFLSLDDTSEAAAVTGDGEGAGEMEVKVRTERESEREGEVEVKPSTSLEVRMDKLQQYIEQLPRNIEDKRKLVDHGYSERLWDQKLSLSVKTDGSLSLEENMRQNLLACYTELVDILKQMAVTHVSVDGEMVKCTELFTDELSLTDLKGRRAVAIRAIDQQRGGLANEGHFYERKIALLAKEDQIEADFEQLSKSAIKPKLFQVVLNTKFFECARCCGTQIIGCYAPAGEHCERPLEIGLRCDSGIASIYDEAGVEIENAELFFTEEGAYLFKAYSNGHPYDTSQVWLSLFTALLKEDPSPLLPAVIVPGGYPNQRTWEALRRCVATEMTGSVLSCRHDFSPEWRTYYDHRPERVRMGIDIVLHSGFSLTSDPNRPVFQRQRSKFMKDIAGLMFDKAMQSLLEDNWLKQFKFLGKAMSQFISVCVNEGEKKSSILSDGFNYDRWKKTVSRSKQLPGNLSSAEDLPTKEEVVSRLVSLIDDSIVQWCEEADLPCLCSANHRQLLELKGFLERARDFRERDTLKDKLKFIRGLLADCMFTVPLLSLPDSLQEEIIHWVFRNEDRVWRYRGGRDGHETLQQFMNFLGRDRRTETTSLVERRKIGDERKGEEMEEGVRSTALERRPPSNPYAGVVIFCVPMATEIGGNIDMNSFQVDQMVAYAVGEMMKQEVKGEPEEIREAAATTDSVDRGGEGRDSNDQLHHRETNSPSSSGGHFWKQQASCYEVVTAWVHPSYRGLGLSTQMYLQVVRQVPARLVVCDMVVGSVERIINSSWLLRSLDWLRVLALVVQRRQLSYKVTTQTGTSEQFEQVLFSVRPMRFSLRVYDTFRWCKGHPKLSAAGVVVPAMALVGVVTVIALKLAR